MSLLTIPKSVQWHSIQLNDPPFRIVFNNTAFGLMSMTQLSVRFRLDATYCYTANEEPVRIQYKCLGPIYVFREMKLCSLVFSKTELYCSVTQFRHSYICERFMYFQDRPVYFAATNMWNDPMNISVGTEMRQHNSFSGNT